MEKLQPLIRNHFWILFGLTLVLPPVGWWMASGALKAEYESRTKTLDDAFKSIPKGTDAPNQDWSDGLTALNEIRKETNRKAAQELWNNQKQLELFAPGIRAYMEKCPYRGEVEDSRVKLVVPSLYRDVYDDEVTRVWLLSEPVDDGTHNVPAGISQKVFFPKEMMPRVPRAKWNAFTPSWKEIWNSSEDLWLLTELLSAVQRVNSVSTSITDAYVRQISEVRLFGGKRTDAATLGSAAAVPGGDPAAGAGFGGFPGAGMTGIGGGARGLLDQGFPADFALSEEYEATGAASTTGAFGGSQSSPMSSGPPSGDPASGGAVGTDTESDEYRYIVREGVYRTRGFKLRVTVHQMKVLDVIRELENSRYPLEVTRFQVAALNPDDPTTTGRGEPGSGNNFTPGGFPGSAPFGGSPLTGSTPMPMESVDTTLSTFGAGTDQGFGGSGFSGPVAAKSPLVQAALREVDLVDLVIVGEIYIYNQPEPEATPPAGSAASPDAAPPTNGEATPEPVPATADPSSVTPTPADSVATPSVGGTTPGEPAAQPASPMPTESSPDAGGKSETPSDSATPDDKPASNEVPKTVPAADM